MNTSQGMFPYMHREWSTTDNRWDRREKYTNERELFGAVEAWVELIGELDRRYLERSSFLTKLKFAVPMSELVLGWSDTGNAKTAIGKDLVRSIDGAQMLEIGMGESTDDSELYGAPSITEAQATGRLIRFPEGTVRDAHIVFFDEWFDAPIGMLRTLLRPLGDREYHRGLDHNGMPLLTAVAVSNHSPMEMEEKDKRYIPLNDRFLFWHHIKDIQNPHNWLLLAQRYAEGVFDQPLPRVELDQLLLMSDVLLSLNLFENSRHMLEAYTRTVRGFAEQTGRRISPRRFARGTTVLELSALMRFKLEVGPEDLDAAQLLFVRDEQEQALWDSLREVALSSSTAAHVAAIQRLDVTQLDKIDEQLPSFTEVQDAYAAAELVELNQRIKALRRDLLAIDTMSEETSTRKSALREILDNQAVIIQRKLDGLDEETQITTES